MCIVCKTCPPNICVPESQTAWGTYFSLPCEFLFGGFRAANSTMAEVPSWETGWGCKVVEVGTSWLKTTKETATNLRLGDMYISIFLILMCVYSYHSLYNRWIESNLLDIDDMVIISPWKERGFLSGTKFVMEKSKVKWSLHIQVQTPPHSPSLHFILCPANHAYKLYPFYPLEVPYIPFQVPRLLNSR